MHICSNELNPMRTTCQLVKNNISAFIEPIKDGVRKTSLICKFVVQHFLSLVMIGLTNVYFKISTNQTLCKTTSRAQGVKITSSIRGVDLNQNSQMLLWSITSDIFIYSFCKSIFPPYLICIILKINLSKSPHPLLLNLNPSMLLHIFQVLFSHYIHSLLESDCFLLQMSTADNNISFFLFFLQKCQNCLQILYSYMELT